MASTVCRSVAAQDLEQLHGLQLGVAISGDSVRVTGRADVDAVFGRVVPGYGTRNISSEADAVLSGGRPAQSARFGPVEPIACSA